MQDASRYSRPCFRLPRLLAVPAFLLSFAATAAAVEPKTFETLEYAAQPALSLVKASALYARGGTGEGVIVGLIDSGLNLDLPSFTGRLADPG